MNCDETKALLPEYQERALPEARLRQADAHLSGCASCREALAAAGNLDSYLRRAIPVPERAPDHWAKQEVRLLQSPSHQARTAPSPRKTIPTYLWVMGTGLGVAALLLVSIGIYVVSSSSVPPTPLNNDVANQPAGPVKMEQRKVSSGSKESPPKSRIDTPIAPTPVAPDPRSFTFPRETPPDDPAPAPRRDPAPVPPQETAVSALLPGDPDHLDRLTDENVEVGLADSSSDRVMGLIKAADGRLSELRAAIGARKETMAEDLAAAYTMICRQGISAVLADRTDDPQDLATARAVAKTYAGWKVDTLSKLEPDARGSLKTAIHEALLATRELAGQ